MGETFDSDFDYAEITARSNSLKSMFENRLAGINTEIENFGNVVGYVDIVSKQVNALNAQKALCESRLSDINNVLANITALLALSAEEKKKLHDYYQSLTMTVDKTDYMKKIVNNYQAILDSDEVTELINDDTNTMENKRKICCILYNQLTTNTSPFM